MSKWTDLLAAAKEMERTLVRGDIARLTPEAADALERLGSAIGECEKPYDVAQDTHAATWFCREHRDPPCWFTFTASGPEVFVRGPQAIIEATFAFAQHFGSDAFARAARYASSAPLVERNQ